MSKLILTAKEAKAERKLLEEKYWSTPWGRAELKEKKKKDKK